MPWRAFDIREFLFVALAAVIGFTVHEFAHGDVAYQLGDDTALRRGRLSLNPLRHIDPIGTVALPLLMIATQMPVVFGWARPVPVDPRRFGNPRRGLSLTAVAGSLANLALAVAFAPPSPMRAGTGSARHG
jgi:Zn-dependent protease